MLKIGDYYDLKQNNANTIKISKEESGLDEDQYFHKEDVKWRVLDIKDDEILLIVDKPLEQKLGLKGKVGYDNGIDLMNRLCREITGYENARNLTLEDIENSKYWEDEFKKDLIFKDSTETFWLANKYKYFSKTTLICGFYFGRGGDCDVTTYAGVFYFSNSDGYISTSYGFRVGVPVLCVKRGDLDERN